VSIHWRFWERRSATQSVFAKGGVAAGGDIRNSPITINQTDNEEVLRQGKETQDLVRQLLAQSQAQPMPGAEKRVGQAVAEIASEAERDNRLQNALALLRANDIAEAGRLLRDVAEDRAARIERDQARIARDRREAAAAYRHLGAIAGLGNPREALEAYHRAIQFDPTDGDSLVEVGWLEKDRGQLDEADRHFHQAMALNGTSQQAHWWHAAMLGLGDVQMRRGNLAAALASYQASHAIRQRLADEDPGDIARQCDLSVSHNYIGDVHRMQGDLAAALASYQASLLIRRRQARADPGNAIPLRDLSISHDHIGDMETAQGNLPAALASYQASLAIRQHLSKTYPGNLKWQRDLSISHDKIGDAQKMLGDLAAALASYRASLVIRQSLIKADPGNAQWQRDLSISHGNIGDVQQMGGNFTAALTSYQASHDIFARIAAADPRNAQWQRDLALCIGRMAIVEAQMDMRGNALGRFRQGREIVELLIRLSPEDATLPRDISWFDEQIESLLRIS
jgi:tetratricopeptide (TPR) repeat protein